MDQFENYLDKLEIFENSKLRNFDKILSGKKPDFVNNGITRSYVIENGQYVKLNTCKNIKNQYSLSNHSIESSEIYFEVDNEINTNRLTSND